MRRLFRDRAPLLISLFLCLVLLSVGGVNRITGNIPQSSVAIAK